MSISGGGEDEQGWIGLERAVRPRKGCETPKGQSLKEVGPRADSEQKVILPGPPHLYCRHKTLFPTPFRVGWKVNETEEGEAAHSPPT